MKKNRDSNFQTNPQRFLVDNVDIRFERLSAYFDGEATPEERREIQALLDTDLMIKRQYHQLHQLRSAIQQIPIPPGMTPQFLAKRVFDQLRSLQVRRFSLWGSTAIAALFIAGIVGRVPNNNQLSIARNTPLPPVIDVALAESGVSELSPSEDALAVPLNRPLLQIPKLANISDS